MMAHYQAVQETDSDVVRVERMMAVLFALAAGAYGVLAVLRGFGILGSEGIDLGMIEGEGVQGPQPYFWDAMLWGTTGIAAGLVAWTFASGRAHAKSETRVGMRWTAYLFAALTQAMILIALLVGFGLVNETSGPTDGLIWAVAAMISAALTGAAYSAIPEALADQDYLVSLVESRAARGDIPGSSATRAPESRMQ
jgi:hypothetical protein